MKLSFVFGTRPEVIKLAPVILEAKRRGHEAQVILTGQHRDMVKPLLDFFGIVSDLDLEVMTPNQTLTSLSERVLHQLDRFKDLLACDFLLTQGDTTSAFIASYWAFCHRIKVAHVEAGLRTNNLQSPFPEEANRQLIGRIADVHFAPTLEAKNALLSEGVSKARISQVGNTSIDSVKHVLRSVNKNSATITNQLQPQILKFIEKKPLILVTAHRRESFGQGIEFLSQGILSVVESNPNVRILYPVHPNPNVREPVQRILGSHPQVHLCEPISYVPFVYLMKRASVLLTDSGGIQEEGPTLRKPILVLRDHTERPEGIKAGFSKLIGTNPARIRKETLKALKEGCRGKGENPYGDGKSSMRIVKFLENHGKI